LAKLFGIQAHKCRLYILTLCQSSLTVILAECRDQGPIKLEDRQRDLDNLCRFADAFPKSRFEAYLLYVKLAPFTADEIAMVSALNQPYRSRVILLTARDLEPYDIFEGIRIEHGISNDIRSEKDMAEVTSKLYFTDPAIVNK
jgi:hypothetical protein